MSDDVMVSVICTAYNHKAYIAQAIESFLMQETDFSVEILIHDDASTDGTAEVIRQYQENFPDRIRVVLQTENQHSKGVKVGNILRQMAQGKYLATCEGDDYWTDPRKLAKQVAFMEDHPACSCCVHGAVKIDAVRGKAVGVMRADTQNRYFTTEEIILGGGDLFPTNSMVYRREWGLSLPPFYQEAPIGDYPIMVYFSLQGDIYYMDELMAAYRINVRGSWTNRQFANSEKRRRFYERMDIMYDAIDRYTDHRYQDSLQVVRRQNRWLQLIEQGRLKEARGEEFRDIINRMTRREKMRLWMKQYIPGVYERLLTLRRRWLYPDR